MKHPKPIDSLIHTIRGQKVLLDADLAELYGVSTKAFNQAIKRNADRFPVDFRFQLTAEELATLRSQPATLGATENDANRSQIVTGSGTADSLRSQIVTLKTGRGQHRKFLSWAFTEHGAIMAASILNSPAAVSMSVFVVRAFVQMREEIMANADVLKRLAEIDKSLLEHDQSLQLIWQELQPLLTPPPDPPKRTIGFHP